MYGDDIIIPQYAAALCSDILNEMGFTVNTDKSYLTGPFKESCGGNYFCGVDITPLKFNITVIKNAPFGVGPEAYEAYCSYANLAYEQKLPMLRLALIKQIFEAGLSPVFTDSLDKSPAIFSAHPTNFHLKKVYKKRYQKYQWMYTGIKPVYKSELAAEDIDEDIYYFDQLLALSKRKDESTNMYNLNFSSSCKRDVIEIHTDTHERYMRETLLGNTTKFSVGYHDI